MQFSRIIYLLFALILLSSCSSSIRFSSEAPEVDNNISSLKGTGQKFRGIASYYADKFNGRQTSNGEIFSNDKFTAAHKTLDFGTLVKVTNLKNNKWVVVRINDRGPFVAGRIIDLSKAAAEKIGMINDGIVEVEIEILK